METTQKRSAIMMADVSDDDDDEDYSDDAILMTYEIWFGHVPPFWLEPRTGPKGGCWCLGI